MMILFLFQAFLMDCDNCSISASFGCEDGKNTSEIGDLHHETSGFNHELTSEDFRKFTSIGTRKKCHELPDLGAHTSENLVMI